MKLPKVQTLNLHSHDEHRGASRLAQRQRAACQMRLMRCAHDVLIHTAIRPLSCDCSSPCCCTPPGSASAGLAGCKSLPLIRCANVAFIIAVDRPGCCASTKLPVTNVCMASDKHSLHLWSVCHAGSPLSQSPLSWNPRREHTHTCSKAMATHASLLPAQGRSALTGQLTYHGKAHHARNTSSDAATTRHTTCHNRGCGAALKATSKPV